MGPRMLLRPAGLPLRDFHAAKDPPATATKTASRFSLATEITTEQKEPDHTTIAIYPISIRDSFHFTRDLVISINRRVLKKLGP